MKNFFRIWFLILLFKIAISAFIPLVADEAYYWIWSLFPNLSYFDHPPMTAWLLWLGQFFDFGFSLVRLPSIIIGHLLWLIWYFIFKELSLPTKQFEYWFWLTLLSPLLGFGSVLTTPDLSLLAFWSLSFYLLIYYLKKPSALAASALGAVLGLAFLAKYIVVLFIPLLVICLFNTKIRAQFSWKHIPFTIFFGLLFCSPVLIWNFKNQWASFQFQLKHGLHQEFFDWRWPVEYFFGQILAIFPLIAYWAWKNKQFRTTSDSTYFLLSVFAFGPLAFFFFTSFRAPVEANWAIIAYPALYALTVTHAAWNFKKQLFTILFWLGCYSYISFALIADKPAILHGKIVEPYLYHSFTPLVEKYKPLYAINYQLAATLWFNSKIPVYKVSEGSRYDFFDTFKESRPQENLFYLIKQKHHDLPPWIEKEGWKAVEVESLSDNYLILEVKK